MIRSPRKLAAPAALIGGALVLAGCSGGGADSASSTDTDATFTEAIVGTITTWNPWESPTSAESKHMAWVYDSLLHQTTDGGVEAWLATSWEQPDASTLDLVLRDDVTFSDGTAFDADAVKANFDYAQSTDTPSECASAVSGIETEVVSATEVTLHMSTPNPDILTDIAGCAGWMVSPTALADPDSLTQSPSGSGPYTLSDSGTIAGQQWTFDKRDDYWSSDTYPFTQVKEVFYSDVTAAANAAQTGDVDLISAIDPKTDTSGLTLVQSAPQEFRGLFITDVAGTICPALGDVRVRQAMNYAIDRDQIAEELYADGVAEVVSSSPFASGSVGYSDELADYYTYDPDKAASLLAEAGYADGFSCDVLNDPATVGDLSTVIVAQLREVGITLTLSDHSDDFVSQLTSGTWAITAGNYTQSASTYANMKGMLSAEGAFFNPLGNSDETFDSLLSSIATTVDEGERDTLYQQLGLAIAEQGWFVAPVQIRSTVGYDADKLTVELTPGNSKPWPYRIGLADA
ncbi:MAG TPA: ABC transporter substrate-binding protein [Cellulomonas sp.]